MKVRVHLYGPFKAFHDGPIELDVLTPKEAIEAITAQLPGFRPDMKTGRKRIVVDGVDSTDDLYAPLQTSDLHIMPAVAFGKDGGLTQIVIGTVLVVAGIFMGGTTWPAIFVSMGASMILGGIMQMIAPAPDLSGMSGDERSRYLGSPGNTVAIGTRIPIAYGFNLVPGHYLAFDIDAKDVGV